MALSPDGSQLVYGVQEADSRQLYRRPIDEFEARPIAGSEGGMAPFFSPDGKWVAFFAEGKLKKVSDAGVGPLLIADLRGVSIGGEGHRWRVAGNWAADDSIFFSDQMAGGLWRVSANGGTPEPVTLETALQKTATDQGDYFPQVLPGGNMVLFTSYRGGNDYRVVVHSLQSGEQWTLIKPGNGARYVSTGHLIYAWEGNLLAAPFDLKRLQVTGPSVRVVEGVAMAGNWAKFSVSENGSLAYVPGRAGFESRFVWVDREGTVEPLPLRPSTLFGPRLSPDGRSFVYWVQNAETTHVWLYDLERGMSSRFTTNPAQVAGGWPIWGPEGKRVIFNSTRSDGMTWNLYWKPVDGSGPAEPLTQSEYSQVPVSVWAKGRLLAFQEVRDPAAIGTDIWILPLQEGARPRPFLQTSANEFLPMFSPDGRWLAYVSDHSGRSEVYVRLIGDS